MAALEKSVGSPSSASIATLGSEPNLVSAIEKLEEKVTLLDKQSLDMLEFRLQSLLDKLKDLKSKPVPSEKLTKVLKNVRWHFIFSYFTQVNDKIMMSRIVDIKIDTVFFSFCYVLTILTVTF